MTARSGREKSNCRFRPPTPVTRWTSSATRLSTSMPRQIRPTIWIGMPSVGCLRRHRATNGRQDLRRRRRRSGIGLPSDSKDSRRYCRAVTSVPLSVLATSSSDWPLSSAARAAATLAALMSCRDGTGNPSCWYAQASALSIVGGEHWNFSANLSFDHSDSQSSRASGPNFDRSNLGGRWPPRGSRLLRYG